ncbi:nucleotidyl transferase AbiEii/AbiGii toxin family protein [Pseudomonas sp. NPDC089569]|uniref:nucleotidyl transferase AbiEii/AbiGii toxin family protein n=1 Tax=Pseudomonas sp. NPDC089569 TaxID=3390722 RepID=UPI003CFDFF93
MATSYFDLPSSVQSELLANAAAETHRATAVIEKDIWITLVLKDLFAMPGRKAMAFKGGTSLSKVYSVIQRFSEDVDVTIDYRELGCEQSVAELSRLSGGKRDKIGEALKAKVREYTHEIVRPYLQSQLASLACGQECDVTVSENGEKLYVVYPTRAFARGQYMREHVLVEFGGRNLINPNSHYTIKPDIAALFPNIDFPIAEGVVVLAPERTFWEKVTLVHAECNRPLADDRNRVSRHWYDLAMLAQHEAGRRAMEDLDLLADVVGLKKVFYRSASAQYDRCLTGELNLMPDSENLVRLENDYREMQGSGMLNGHVYPIADILALLSTLQGRINQLTLAKW